MTLVELIQKYVSRLPPDKQIEVLDFIAFLQQQAVIYQAKKHHSLKDHASFGSWKNRKINAIQYQDNLRAEWDH